MTVVGPQFGFVFCTPVALGSIPCWFCRRGDGQSGWFGGGASGWYHLSLVSLVSLVFGFKGQVDFHLVVVLEVKNYMF